MSPLNLITLQVLGLYVPEPGADDKAPASVTDLAASFPNGALSGTVSFAVPTTLYDGTTASGALTYEVLANGRQVATGSTSFGASVSAPVTLTEAGEYTFVAMVSNAVGASPKAKTTVFVGHGTPEAPKASLKYEGGKMKLSWTPVATSIDGGYIDAATVTYTVTRYPGETVVAAKKSETTFEEAIAEPDALVMYYYTVVAHAADKNSAPGQSNTVVLGSIKPPYTNDFSSDNALEGFTIIDANDDGRQWLPYDGKVRVSYNSSIAMDDWLITPPLKLEAGKVYHVSFNAFGQQSGYTERLEVKWGKEATSAGLTNTLVPVTELTSQEPRSFEAYLQPDATGTYFIGFHGVSEADQYYLYVDDLNIAAGLATTAPAGVTDLKFTPDPAGAYKLTVSFKAPAKDFNGDAISSLTKIEVSRDGEIVKTFNAPTPGAALSFVDTGNTNGNVTYSVVAYNASGAGVTVSGTGHMGVDAPAAPANIKVVETATPGEITVTWDPVTTDVNGNPINSDLVEYIVAQYDSNSGSWVEAHDTELRATTLTYQAVPAGEQDFVDIAVFAGTEGGENADVFDQMLAVGTPYPGMTESFADAGLSYIIGTGYSAGSGSWKIYPDDQFRDITSVDDDGGFAGMFGEYLDSSAALFTGKISLAGMKNPGISLCTFNIGGDDINEIQLYVKDPAAADWTALGQPVVINTLSQEEGWCQLTASLAAYAGKTLQVRIQATTKMYQYTMIDRLKIGDLLAQDLVTSAIQAPASVAAGAAYKVDVTVANEGMADATEFTVELYADSELAESRTVASLASGAKATVSFDLAMSPVADTPVDYFAKVVYTADENTDNNTTENVSVAPKHSNLPAVTDLSAKDTAAGVELAWSEPDLTAAPAQSVEVDFEDGTAWAKTFEGWTFVDVDNKVVGGFQGMDLPGIEPGVTTASFFVFDASGDEFNATFDAHSGNMYLASLFIYDGTQADDWAISPALDGSAQTISFYARSYSDEYPESIEMYYSTGSLDTSDFVKVGTPISPVPGEWTRYAFDVPAGAKYFAIRSFATDSFMLMLDDFTFVPSGAASADLTIVGYDVYRDGVKITEAPTGETEYIDTTASEGEHSYAVVTVYATGISAPSNIVTLKCSDIDDALSAATRISAGKGFISVAGAAGKHVSIATIDGKIIYSADGRDSHTVGAASGVYVVKAGAIVEKVAVK